MMGFERGAKEWDIGERRIISHAPARDGACAFMEEREDGELMD